MTNRRRPWTAIWLLEYRQPVSGARWTHLVFRTRREVKTYITHELPPAVEYHFRKFIPYDAKVSRDAS